MRPLISTLLTAFFLIAFGGPAYAKTTLDPQDDGPVTLFEHMQTRQLLQVTMEMDIQALLANKKTNDFLPAKFTFRNAQGQLAEWDIEVRVRGRFRRMTCEFPPLKLKFPKAEMKAEGFGKHNDVKLVTHCMDNDKAEETLFREYLTYQMYAQLTDVSFRTQLIQITYRDIHTGAETNTYGILIEDADELAERMNAKECDECYGMGAEKYQEENLRTHALFQYMIGNTDWNVPMMRNLKVLTSRNEGEKALVAPYDFDFSGLVNAEYAKPNVDLKQKDIRDRYYLGEDWTEAEWAATFNHFQQKRTDLMRTVDNFEMISNKARKDMKKYIESFYSELDAGFRPQNALTAGVN